MESIYKKVKVEAKSTTICTYYEVVEHNGKKFLIYIEFSNGDIIGFNKKCCLSVMNPNGSWDYIVDNKQLGFVSNNDLYYAHNAQDKTIAMNDIALKFRDYIKAIY